MSNTSNNLGTPETNGSTQGATANDRLDKSVQPPIDPLTNQLDESGKNTDAKGGTPKAS